MGEKGQVNIKVKILTAPRQRVSKFGTPSSSTDVVENRTFVTKTLFMPTAMTPKATVGSFCLIRNCVVGESIRATQKSMIMACGPFPFDRKVEEDFLTPEILTISEARACPPKRRLSLTATLVSTSDVLTTETSRRKVLRLQDAGAQEFSVKLWGEEVDLPLPTNGATVVVGCVTIAEFGGRKEANSTNCTTITEIADDVPFEGTIDAISIDEYVSVLTPSSTPKPSP